MSIIFTILIAAALLRLYMFQCEIKRAAAGVFIKVLKLFGVIVFMIAAAEMIGR